MRFSIADDKIEIEGRAVLSPGHKVRTELTEFSRMILDTVADSASLQQLDGTPTFTVTKTKKDTGAALT